MDHSLYFSRFGKNSGHVTTFVWKLERGMQERGKVMVQERSRIQVE
jgi:hypothetical protein